MNPYDVLGISRGASREEVTHAYRMLAKQFHPDVNHAPDAEKRFKEVQEAYETLTNPQPPKPAPRPAPTPAYGYVWVRVNGFYWGFSSASTSTTAGSYGSTTGWGAI